MNHSLPFLANLLLMTSIAFAQTPVRVACIGDSITYGDQLADRDTQSYPAVLVRLSEGRVVAGNFGVNGATAVKIPFRSWSDMPACRDALAFAPSIAVVMLGINDLAFPDVYDRYPADLRDIVVRFQSLPSAPRVFLCTLTPIAPAEEQSEANRLIRDRMNPAIRAIAAETGATVIDITSAYPNRLELLPDGLHPSPAGAEIIARTVLAAIEEHSSPAPRIQPAPAAGPVDLSIRNEALAARGRAEQWMKTQSPPPPLPDPSSFWEGRELRSPTDAAELLPMLAGDPAPAGNNSFFSYAALAFALHRIGHETVFLAFDRPVVWRGALLHQIVQRQRIDARGGGFWQDPADNAIRSTAYALQALATALGE